MGPDSNTSHLRATQHKTEHTRAHMLKQTGSVARREAQKLGGQEEMCAHQLKDGYH